MTTTGTRGRGGSSSTSTRGARGGGARAAARPRKTAEELDAEMEDYFEKKTN